MFKALKSPRSVLPAHRPVTVCTVLLSTLVLTAGPAFAEQLRMDHENVTVEPIEVIEDSPEIPAEASHGAFDPIYEDQAPAAASKPILDEGEAVPAVISETIHETAAGSETAPSVEVKSDDRGSADRGPEVESQPVADPFGPTEAAQPADEVAAESAPEADSIDPLMEAAEAHEEAGDVEGDENETVAAEPATPAAQGGGPRARPSLGGV